MCANVCVVGSGVVGLTTALIVQQQNPKSQVRILSDKYSPDTTSNIAAGIFSWGPNQPDKKLDRQWAEDSWKWYSDLLNKNDPEKTGVTSIQFLNFSQYHQQNVEKRYMKDLCPVYRDLTERELNLALPEGKFKFGKYLQTMQIEMDFYLNYLTEEFKSKGGVLTQGRVDSWHELAGQCDVAVNCTGLGARWLCNDTEVLPIRGQVLRVEAPWIKTVLYADDVYLIPGQRWVTVGGTRQYNDWMTEVSPHDSARIWSRATQIFPTLAGAKVLEERVGLRPHRYTPRVELEQVLSNLYVVHNYGHCGYGALSSPGTSLHAAKLVQKIINE